MKIAHIVCTYPPYYSGMGNAALEMVSGLRRLGHDLAVYTPMYKEPEAPAEEVPDELEEEMAYAERLAPSISFGKAARLPHIARELDQFDVVHLHYPFYGTANMVRRWKMKHPDKPLVVTYHMDTRGPGWKGAIFKIYTKFWMPRILRSADLLIGSSFDYIKHSQAAGMYEADPHVWKELPFGVDIERFKPRDRQESLYAQYDLDPAQPTVLFVGGMDAAHYFKGIPVLLKALLMAKKNDTAIQGIFVGDGELREGFEFRAKAYGLGRYVRFVGKVSHGDLPYHYNMADLLVLPSIHMGEAFGMVLLEAMASGTPVLASDLPGVRTVARKGGLTFTPGDQRELFNQMVSFFGEENNREHWRVAVRTVAEQEYSWDLIVRQLEGFYMSLVNT